MQSWNIWFPDKNQVEVRQEPVRSPEEGEVLVRAVKSLISTGTETICLGHLFEPGTHWDRWVKYPFPPGYSLVGQVVAVGSAVQNVKEGDRVAVQAPHHQYVLRSAESLHPIPDGVSDEEAAWFALSNIVQNAVRRARHELGETVVIIGLGPLGQLVVQYVRLMGAREVIAIDPVQYRLEMARAHGATLTLPMTVEEAKEEVLRLTEGAGAEVVYDVTGHSNVFEAALPLLRRFGRLVLLGDTGTPSAQRLTGDLITKGLTVIGAHSTNPPPVSTDHAFWSHHQMTRLFFTYLQHGEMRVSDLITHRYSPLEAPETYRLLREERGATMGVVFEWLMVDG